MKSRHTRPVQLLKGPVLAVLIGDGGGFGSLPERSCLRLSRMDKNWSKARDRSNNRDGQPSSAHGRTLRVGKTEQSGSGTGEKTGQQRSERLGSLALRLKLAEACPRAQINIRQCVWRFQRQKRASGA